MLSLYLSAAEVEIQSLSKDLLSPGDMVEVRVSFQSDSIIPDEKIWSLFSNDELVHLESYLSKPITKPFSYTAKIVIGPRFPHKPISFVDVDGERWDVKLKEFSVKKGVLTNQKEFEYIDFPLSRESFLRRHPFLVGVVVTLLCLLAVIGLSRVYLKNKQRNALKLELLNWIRRFESASNISSLSAIWLERDDLKERFPGCRSEIEKLFFELNKYQFLREEIYPAPDDLQDLKKRLLEAMRKELDRA
jgi:hypothetical protein